MLNIYCIASGLLREKLGSPSKIGLIREKVSSPHKIHTLGVHIAMYAGLSDLHVILKVYFNVPNS